MNHRDRAYSPPREEGWTRHKENAAEPPLFGADGVVARTEAWLVSDHPGCGAKVGFAHIFLMPQPPLLTRRGMPRAKRLNSFAPSSAGRVREARYTFIK